MQELFTNFMTTLIYDKLKWIITATRPLRLDTSGQQSYLRFWRMDRNLKYTFSSFFENDFKEFDKQDICIAEAFQIEDSGPRKGMRTKAARVFWLIETVQETKTKKLN